SAVRRGARRLGAVPVQRDHLRPVAGEREAADLVVFGLLSRGEIDNGHLVLHRTSLLAEASGFALRRIDRESHELRVARDRQRRRRSAGERVPLRRRWLTDREALLRRAVGGLPDDNRRVALVRY